MTSTVASADRYYPVIATVLTLAYLAGIVGLQLPALEPFFRPLIPVNLAASLALLLLYHTDWRPSFLFYAGLAVLTGFFVEVLGVHTGYIFGQYAYGSGLGYHLWAVPPVIGLNWLTLSYCCGTVCDRLPFPVYMKAIAAATLMVGLDIFIEPVAIRLDFWTWFGQPVPLRNYLGWWFVSLALLAVWYGLPFQKKNKLAALLLLLQFVFFVGHNLIFLLQSR
ncbi:hypothetical protein GCM10023189_53350 [Nibrella saemangeumensis]|uniref:Carotenoid biosynthesis protein n=1 Tax=Nibrella saemangeumensis TaxID=1084526 RepID=A0ABP8NJB4_9BACT